MQQWCVAWLALLALAPRAAAQENPFAFPGDAWGRRLETMLRPGADAVPRSRTVPLPHAAPRELEDPAVPFPGAALAFPRLAPPGARPSSPPAPPDPPPLARFHDAPTPPVALALPAGKGVRWPSVKVDERPRLPYLGTPLPDRAPLADATMEASQAAALPRVHPRSLSPLPFAPVNLPDPFELRRAVELRHPPAENPMPPITSFPR